MRAAPPMWALPAGPLLPPHDDDDRATRAPGGGNHAILYEILPNSDSPRSHPNTRRRCSRIARFMRRASWNPLSQEICRFSVTPVNRYAPLLLVRNVRSSISFVRGLRNVASMRIILSSLLVVCVRSSSRTHVHNVTPKIPKSRNFLPKNFREKSAENACKTLY